MNHWLKCKTAWLLMLSFWVCTPNLAQATPVVDPAMVAPMIAINGAMRAIDASLGKISTQQIFFEGWVKKDGLIKPSMLAAPSPLAAIVATSGGAPDLDNKAGLAAPDVILDASKILHYDFNNVPIPGMCPGTVKPGTTQAAVPNIAGYSELYETMCKRVFNLRAFKIDMTNQYLAKINRLQGALTKVTLTPSITTGTNAGTQTDIQALRALEQVVTTEYQANMALADAQMVVAEDMKGYAAGAIVKGPPATLATAVTTQAVKAGIGLAVNAAVTFAAPYNK
jgi:hypothetical protein